MSALAWEERVELAQRYAPRLILFPEKKELGKPKIEGGAGDYHPRSLELLLERGRLYPGTLRTLGQLKFAWLFSQLSRMPATFDNLAQSHHAFDQIRLLGGPIPKADQAWDAYFDILNSIDAQGQSGYDRFPLTTYVHVITRAEAEQASRTSAKIKPADYAGKVGRPFYQPAGGTQPDDLALQYWLCYYFDDWANIHEGDWESITLFCAGRTTRGCRWVQPTPRMRTARAATGKTSSDLKTRIPWFTWHLDHTLRIFSTSWKGTARNFRDTSLGT